MDASIITALAALTGSLVGGLTTFATTWFTHRYQARRERTAKEIAKREALYGDFINEATRVGINATEREIDSLSELTQLLALINRIRLTSSDEVLAAAEAVLMQIGETVHGRQQDPAGDLRRGTKPRHRRPIRCGRSVRHADVNYRTGDGRPKEGASRIAGEATLIFRKKYPLSR